MVLSWIWKIIHVSQRSHLLARFSSAIQVYAADIHIHADERQFSAQHPIRRIKLECAATGKSRVDRS